VGVEVGDEMGEATQAVWRATGKTLDGTPFRYQKVNLQGAKALWTAPDGSPLVTRRRVGAGQVILTTIPYLLGIDGRATPVWADLMIHLTAGLLPVEVRGDVEWQINRTATGYVLLLFNNRGNYKPQQGLAAPRREEVAEVSIETSLPLVAVQEWTENAPVAWERGEGRQVVRCVIPAGGIRVVALVTGDE
jgi:hypothetical protein